MKKFIISSEDVEGGYYYGDPKTIDEVLEFWIANDSDCDEYGVSSTREVLELMEIDDTVDDKWFDIILKRVE